MAEIATLIAALATLAAALTNTIITYRARDIAVGTREDVREVHLTMNSRLDELVEATRNAAHAEGLQEGRDEK